jgi:hypothetical protein
VRPRSPVAVVAKDVAALEAVVTRKAENPVVTGSPCEKRIGAGLAAGGVPLRRARDLLDTDERVALA